MQYWDEAGSERALRLAGEGRAEEEGIVLSAWQQRASDGNIIHAKVENEHGKPVRLNCVAYELDTGFDCLSPVRFFKHGYQSWSRSYPLAFPPAADLEAGSLLTRVNHQGEAKRVENTPENTSSELFTI
ncbi:MAG TPA: hypothetical protein VJ728_07610, partial [Candidatus Binataceae bacterium]|nr:hypothetical protein [Candidatus Binataceae bacterium]